MRILVALLLLPAGCDRAPSPAEKTAGMSIPCALDGARDYDTRCMVSRERSGDGAALLVTAPDGRFRRFVAGPDGTGIDTADGAARVRTLAAPAGQIGIEVERDRYRLPGAR